MNSPLAEAWARHEAARREEVYAVSVLQMARSDAAARLRALRDEVENTND